MEQKVTLGLELPRHGSRTISIFPFVGGARGVPKVLYRAQEALVTATDKKIALFGSRSGKTTAAILLILNEIVNTKKKEVKNLVEQISYNFKVPSETVHKFIGGLMKGELFSVQKGKLLYVEEKEKQIIVRPVIRYLESIGKITTAVKGQTIHIKAVGGPPRILFIYGSNGGIIQMLSLVNSLIEDLQTYSGVPVVFTSKISKHDSDVMVIHVADIDTLINKPPDWLSSIETVIIDDIHNFDISELRYKYLHLLRRISQKGGKITKEVIIGADITNAKEIANYILGDKHTFIRSDGRLGSVNLTVIYEPETTLERCYNIVKDAISKNKKVRLFAADWTVQDIAEYLFKKTKKQIPIGVENIDTLMSANCVIIPHTKAESYVGPSDIVVFYGHIFSIHAALEIAMNSITGMGSVDVVFILRDRAVDGFFLRNYKKLLSKPQYKFLSLGSTDTAKKELLAATTVAPLTDQQASAYHPRALPLLLELKKDGLVSKSEQKYVPTKQGEELLKHKDEVSVIYRGETLKRMEPLESFLDLYPGRILSTLKQTYEVLSVDLDKREAKVRVHAGKKTEYDTVLSETKIESIKSISQPRRIGKLKYYLASLGIRFGDKVCLSKRVVDEKKWHEAVKAKTVTEQKEFKLQTTGLVINLSRTKEDSKSKQQLIAPKIWKKFTVDPRIHAVSHALLYAIHMFTGEDITHFKEYCDQNKIIIYPVSDRYYSATESVSRHFEDIARMAKDFLIHCPSNCKDSCPKCMSLPRCSFGNLWIDRVNAIGLM